MATRLFNVIIGVLACIILQAKPRCLSPLDFGLSQARDGTERYEALQRCHERAVLDGVGVTYKGIDSLFLEIPFGAKGIPVSTFTDYCGAVITVRNQSQDVYLFTLINTLQPISLTAQQVDNGNFLSNRELSKGEYLDVVKVKNPWIQERLGYGYPHYHHDVLLVHDGKSKNRVIMPYNNSNSDVECSFRKVSLEKKEFCSLHFIRDVASTHKTRLLRVVGEHNVRVKKVSVLTPNNETLFGDHMFMVENSTCFKMEDVQVEGTYSQKKVHPTFRVIECKSL